MKEERKVLFLPLQQKQDVEFADAICRKGKKP
jgi:hypothetical protein